MKNYCIECIEGKENEQIQSKGKQEKAGSLFLDTASHCQHVYGK